MADQEIPWSVEDAPLLVEPSWCCPCCRWGHQHVWLRALVVCLFFYVSFGIPVLYFLIHGNVPHDGFYYGCSLTTLASGLLGAFCLMIYLLLRWRILRE